MWRLREEHSNREYITKGDVHKAIMFECGLDDRTIRNKYNALKTLGWIRCDKKLVYIVWEADYD